MAAAAARLLEQGGVVPTEEGAPAPHRLLFRLPRRPLPRRPLPRRPLPRSGWCGASCRFRLEPSLLRRRNERLDTGLLPTALPAVLPAVLPAAVRRLVRLPDGLGGD